MKYYSGWDWFEDRFIPQTWRGLVWLIRVVCTIGLITSKGQVAKVLIYLVGLLSFILIPADMNKLENKR
jgi:hypothetical protein